MTESPSGPGGTSTATLPMRTAHQVVAGPLLWWLRAIVTGASQVPRTGGALLAANHRSFLDHFALGAASPRPMRFFGKASLAEGMAGRYNLAMGMIPVERGTGDLDSVDLVSNMLRGGAIIGIFPEGTRSPTGELFKFRSGMARMAAAAEVPIIPVGMTGTASVWPRGAPRPSGRRPRRGIVGIHFGAPVWPEETARSRRTATRDVYDQVAQLCGQPQAGCYADIPDS